MAVTLLFWVLALLCCGVVAAFGDKDGQRAAGLCAGATVVTMPAQLLDPGWIATNEIVMVVDLLLFVGLSHLAMTSRRFWPLWMAGFQLVTVATHLASLTGPSFLPRLYTAMSTLWSVPILLAMLVGVILDNRAGLDRPHSAALPD